MRPVLVINIYTSVRDIELSIVKASIPFGKWQLVVGIIIATLPYLWCLQQERLKILVEVGTNLYKDKTKWTVTIWKYDNTRQREEFVKYWGELVKYATSRGTPLTVKEIFIIVTYICNQSHSRSLKLLLINYRKLIWWTASAISTVKSETDATLNITQ